MVWRDSLSMSLWTRNGLCFLRLPAYSCKRKEYCDVLTPSCAVTAGIRHPFKLYLLLIVKYGCVCSRALNRQHQSELSRINLEVHQFWYLINFNNKIGEDNSNRKKYFIHCIFDAVNSYCILLHTMVNRHKWNRKGQLQYIQVDGEKNWIGKMTPSLFACTVHTLSKYCESDKSLHTCRTEAGTRIHFVWQHILGV